MVPVVAVKTCQLRQSVTSTVTAGRKGWWDAARFVPPGILVGPLESRQVWPGEKVGGAEPSRVGGGRRGWRNWAWSGGFASGLPRSIIGQGAHGLVSEPRCEGKEAKEGHLKV